MSSYTAVEYAKKALQLAWDGRLPVDPTLITQGLFILKPSHDGQQTQVPIRVRALSNADLGGFSGQASIQNGEYYCDYNADEISYRSRFTIAHELGHVLLGHVNEGNPRQRDTTFSNGDPIERAANMFAAELIMPDFKVRELYGSARNIQQLAEAFGVSTAAMSYRLKNLGLAS